jgi:hypothetical protein
MNTANCKKYRNDPANKETWKKNNKKYFANWLKKDPINWMAHKYRTKLASIKLTLLKSPHGETNLKEDSKTILQAVRAIGWNEYLDKSIALNHKVSILLLLQFNPQTPVTVCYSKENLELIPSVLNNRASKRRINSNVLKVALRLEKLHPFYLSGLTDFLLKRRGEII